MANAYKTLITSDELLSNQILSYNVATNTSELTLNQSISGSIDQQGEQDIFTFTGTVGQVLYYDARQINLSDNIRVRLVDPSGNTVFIDQEADIDYPNFLSDSGPQPLITLTQSGTYQLIFETNSPDSFTPGDYNFELIDVTSTPTVSLNQVISDILSPGGEADLYRFTVKPGQLLYFESQTSDSYSGASQFYYPNGEFFRVNSLGFDLPLFTAFLDLGRQSYFSPGFIPEGTYTLVLNGLSDKDINYSFQLISLNSELTLNTRITGTIDEPEKFFTYTFTGTAGQILYYDALNNDNDNILVSLLTPSGELSPFARDADEDTIFPTLRETGTYTLILGIPGGTDQPEAVGTYDFRVINTELNTVNFNTAVSGSLSADQQADVYSFRGQAGQKVIFDSFTDGFPSASWTLYVDEPRYNVFTPVAFGGNISNDFQATLIPSPFYDNANYVLVINAESATDINYEFNIININSTDIITGTSARDNLIGTDANNIIIGLEGPDVLTGGLGADIFRYSSNTEGGDRITDFTVGSDKIDLSEVLDNLGYTGTDAIADGYIQFGSRGRLGTSINIDPDGFAGSAKARNFIVVENVDAASLSNSDNFLFFDT